MAASIPSGQVTWGAGSSITLALPNAPTAGNQLIVMGLTEGAAPSLTGFGLTLGSYASGSTPVSISTYVRPVQAGDPRSATFNMGAPSVLFLFELAGLALPVGQ